MIKEVKYLLFIFVIFTFIYFTGKHYFSDINKKKSYRSLKNINQKITLYSQNIPILENNTQNIIEYVENKESKKKKKYFFWELIN
jgi:hypothetical protein|tara:strand:+ start:360 stop:614 length:255 start_codon:yes stop_codon:yes gene_type:complete